MTAPINRPLRSRIGAAESWIAISWPRRLTSSDGSIELDHAAFAQAAQDRAVERLAGRFVQHLEHLGDRLPGGFAGVPAGELLGDGIEVVDAAVGIRRDDRVADRLQRDLRLLLLLEELDLGALALGDVGERAFVADD